MNARDCLSKHSKSLSPRPAQRQGLSPPNYQHKGLNLSPQEETAEVTHRPIFSCVACRWGSDYRSLVPYSKGFLLGDLRRMGGSKVSSRLCGQVSCYSSMARPARGLEAALSQPMARVWPEEMANVTTITRSPNRMNQRSLSTTTPRGTFRGKGGGSSRARASSLTGSAARPQRSAAWGSRGEQLVSSIKKGVLLGLNEHY